jgi:transposase-like protein
MKRAPLEPQATAAAKLAIAGGSTIKAAADRFGISFEALRKRAQREKWPSAARVNREAERIVSSLAISALAEPIAENASRYTENLSRAGIRFSETVAGLDGQELLKRSRDIAALDAVSRKALGLDQEKTSPNAINIAVLGEIGVSESESAFYRQTPPQIPGKECIKR